MAFVLSSYLLDAKDEAYHSWHDFTKLTIYKIVHNMYCCYIYMVFNTNLHQLSWGRRRAPNSFELLLSLLTI